MQLLINKSPPSSSHTWGDPPGTVTSTTVLVCTSPAWYLLQFKDGVLKLAPCQSLFTSGLRWPVGATGQKPLQWVPETTPRLLRVQVPMQSQLPRLDMVINSPVQCREHSQETTSYQVKRKYLVRQIVIKRTFLYSAFLVVYYKVMYLSERK